MSIGDGCSTKDDEQIASALSYVVHMLLLISKYLEVGLSECDCVLSPIAAIDAAALPDPVPGIEVDDPRPRAGERGHPAALPPQCGEGAVRASHDLVAARHRAVAAHERYLLRAESRYFVQSSAALSMRNVPQTRCLIKH